jgi:hypothetical protein
VLVDLETELGGKEGEEGEGCQAGGALHVDTRRKYFRCFDADLAAGEDNKDGSKSFIGK